MVAKKKKAGKVKVGNLKLNKETVKNLTVAETKKVKGGVQVKKPGSGRACYQ